VIEGSFSPITAKLDELSDEVWNIREWHKLAEKYLHTVARDVGAIEPGSSRSVFAIGADKVVKIAFNQFGREQNQREEFVYDYHGDTGLILPVFAGADDGRWIVMAQAKRLAKWKDLWGVFGMAPSVVLDALNGDEWSIGEVKKNRTATAVLKLIKKAGLEAADIIKPESWGLQGGKWRLLDYGLGRGQVKRAAIFKQF